MMNTELYLYAYKKASSTTDWESVRTGLNDVLGVNDNIVEYASDKNMPTKHIVPYARQILLWHPDAKHDGKLEMYFNKKGYPLGYNFVEETGIHTDASDKELLKARIVARLSKDDKRLDGIKTAKDVELLKRNKDFLDRIRLKKHEAEQVTLDGKVIKHYA